MFDRTIRLIGKENFDLITNKKIMIIGVGGVGGVALEALVRTGINNLIIVDYDKVEESNINRQIIADYNKIGLLKVNAWEERILKINPKVNITKLNIKLTSDNLEEYISQDIDFIIDACDTISVKKKLITLCHKLNIKLITATGTGNKIDPTKLEICDVRKTAYDPICKILRKFIKDEKINYKVMVVASTEAPKKIASPVSSIIFVPSVAGLLLAYYVINNIINEKNR